MLKCLTLLLTLNSCEPVFSKPETATSLNAFRTANGLPVLRSDAHLTALARAHAEDMARRGALDHAGFMQRRGARAENVSYGCKDTPCAIRQWAGSSGHRRNMLLPEVRSYGLAYADSRSGRRYWALELGD